MPIGAGWSNSNYEFRVFDRWGNVIVNIKCGKDFLTKKKDVEIVFKENTVLQDGSKLIKIIFNTDENLIEIFTSLAGVKNSKKIFAGDQTKIQYVTEYAKLFRSAMVGSQDVYVSFKEIKHMWQFTDLYINSKNMDTEIIKYKRQAKIEDVFEEC